MGGWLGFLVFAAFFFVMMRFGCGAHAGHGGHGGHDHGGGGHNVPDTSAGGTDPVCGMQVEPNKGFAKYHEGRLYRFCSKNCLDKFEVNPAQYTGVKPGNKIEGGHEHRC